MTKSKRVLPIGILEKHEKGEIVFNAKNETEKPFTNGEYFLAKYLDENLPDEWMIHTKPELRNRWGSFIRPTTPDIVIASKHKGIMIIEVKDWKIEKSKYKRRISKNSKGKEICKIFIDGKNIINPVEKSILYKKRMLDGIDDISREIFDDTRKYSLLKCGLYFHNCKTEEARNFLNSHDQLKCIVFGNDYLDKSVNIEKFIPILKIGKNINSNQNWLLKFKNWISPPMHSIEGKDLVSENDLDEHQKKYVRSSPNKIQKVSGVAGCGKTRIIATRAASLAATKKKVLVVCFNITQRNYLKEFISRTNYLHNKGKIDVFYFQDFCQAYREDRDLPFPESTTYIRDKIEDLGDKEKEEIINDKNNNNDLSYNYDAILIDEGQDFKDTWFKLLRCFLNENGEMLIAIDYRQNIYERKKPTISGIGGGRWGILKKSYRLLNEHINLANKFSKNFLSDLNLEENPLIDKNISSQKSLPFDNDPVSKWINVSNIVEARDEICKILYNLHNVLKTDISDIVILVPDHDEGIELKKQIIENFPKKFAISDIFHKEYAKMQQSKKLFSVSDKTWDQKTKSYIEGRKLKMCTIQSFKGWERRNVIILIPAKVSNQFDKRFYTSLTRVREKFFVVNLSDRYRSFGKENFNQYL